jgi:hypothetical protein
MIYNRAFKVPTWVVLGSMSKNRAKAVSEFFNEAGARYQEWPANLYPEALLNYRNKGYADALPEYPFILETNLMLRSAGEHLKDCLSPKSQLGGSSGLPPHRVNRKADSRDDLVTIFNDLLSLEDPISLSQVFQIAELCHRDGAKQFKAFVSSGKVPKNLLTKIADRVITVGDGAENDIVVDGLSNAEIADKLENFFTTN